MTTRISEATRDRITLAWENILSRLAAGELVHEAIKAHGFSAAEIRCYRTSTAGAQAGWDAAREDSADALFDEAMSLARNPVKVVPQEDGKEPLIIRLDSAHTRNALDTLKWAARIRNPRLYGDKAQLDVNVRTVDLTRIISEANARLANAPRARILEHNQAPAALLPAVIQARELADLM